MCSKKLLLSQLKVDSYWELFGVGKDCVSRSFYCMLERLFSPFYSLGVFIGRVSITYTNISLLSCPYLNKYFKRN